MSLSTLASSDSENNREQRYRQHVYFLLQLIDNSTRRKNDHKVSVLIEQELYRCDDKSFRRHFGLGRNQFHRLTAKLQSRIRLTHTRFSSLKNLRPRDRIAICLKFLASGRSFDELSTSYKIPEETVRTIVYEVCATIRRYLGPSVMPQHSEENWLKIAREFRNVFHLPNCLGAMNIFQVSVMDEELLDVVAIVDAYHRVIKIDVGKYNLNRNVAETLSASKMGRGFLKNKYDVPANRPVEGYANPVPYVIVGDSTYPSKPYLLSQYRSAECAGSVVNTIFNGRLERAVAVGKQGMIQLCQRWRIFEEGFPVPPSQVKKIVQAACVLHNYFTVKPDAPVARNLYYPTVNRSRLQSLRDRIPDESVDVIRYKFHKYFLSNQGHVPWQWEVLHGFGPETSVTHTYYHNSYSSH